MTGDTEHACCAKCATELNANTAGWLEGDLVCWPGCPEESA